MTPPSALTFGALLRQLRKRAGLTQGDLATAVGYSVSFVCDLEQDRRLPAVAVVLQQFIPALGLQAEASVGAQLVELAALARGERPPATVTVQRTTQLTATETFTVGRSMDAGDQPGRLPALPIALIGREQAIKTLCNRLQGHSGRLLTLVGPPGVGKTTLALAVAAHSASLYRDGAYFVPLAALRDPTLVAAELVATLPINDQSQRLPKGKVIEFLRRKEVLLVLDNFEQITAAAGLVAELLAECPHLYILVTSRERLHLRAEQRYQVPPLLLDWAVTLFTQRAQAVDLAFEPTAEQQPVIAAICQRLDCLPLAIELIAAHIDLFSLSALLTRLQEQRLDALTDGAQDAPTHQRTLRTAIQYSYTLLNERERALFQTLSVFVGGFDLAAVAYFGFGPEVLQGLINKSLVQIAGHADGSGERRFLLLETLRDYARERLVADQQATVTQQRHAVYYAQWVATIEPHLRGAQATVYVAQLEMEHNNVRAALAWLLAQGDAAAALRLSGALGQFWLRHDHVREGKSWLAQTLALGANEPSAAQAKACMTAGELESFLGDFRAAQTLFARGLALYRADNDRTGEAWALLMLGDALYGQNAYAQAGVFYQQSLALYQDLADQEGLANVATSLGWFAVSQGDYEQARRHFVHAVALRREQGEAETPTTLLKGLACVASQQQDYAQAIAYFTELLARAQALADTYGMAHTLNHLGRLALYQGDLVRATPFLTEGFRLALTLDNPALHRFALDNQGNLAFAQGQYSAAIRYYSQSLQVACQIADQFSIATLLERFAGAVDALQKAEPAARLLGAAAKLHEALGAPLRPLDQPRYQALLLAVCTQLGESAYAIAYAAGYAMTTDQAVAFALAQLVTLA